MTAHEARQGYAIHVIRNAIEDCPTMGTGGKEIANRTLDALMADLAEARALVEQAKTWYRDHVSEEGFYDEALWGDPFAVSPQLREALAAVPDPEEPTT